MQQQNQVTDMYLNNLYTSRTNRDVSSRNLSNSIDANLDYMHTYKPQQELSLSLQMSRSNITNNFTANFLNGGNEILRRQKNLNDNTNKEMVFQADYQTPLGTRQLVEVGAKGTIRQVDSQFEYLSAIGNSELFVPDLSNTAGALNYQQAVEAGYLSYTYASRTKYTIKAGARYEHTDIDAFNADGSRLPIPAYGNLVPSINVSKPLSQNTTLKAAYNRRIQRPFLQQLNPNVNASNPQNITKGNPLLNPELTDNVELSLSTTIKKVYLNASVFGRQSSNAINQVRLPSDSIPGGIITTFGNVGVEQTVGSNVFANVQLTTKWSINGGFDVYYRTLEGQVTGLNGRSVTQRNSGFVVGGRLMTQIMFGKGWGIQANTFVSGPRLQLQGQQGGMYMYSLGIRRDFANKQGSIGLATENFLGGVQMTSSFSSPSLQQESINRLYNQNIKLTLNYRVGKMTFEPRKRKKNNTPSQEEDQN